MGASGFSQSDIVFGPELGGGSGTVPTINPVTTVLCGPFDCRNHSLLSGFFENPDVAQTLQVVAEVSWDGLTKWSAVRQYFDLADILPGEIRPWNLDVSPYRYVRFTATASGAGVSGAQMRVLRTYGSGGPTIALRSAR